MHNSKKSSNFADNSNELLMKHVFFLFTLLFTTSLFAQTNSVAYELMMEAVDKGNYTQALSYAEKMVNSDRTKYGAKHIEYAGSLVNLGLVYAYIGDYKQAESNYLKALDICKSTSKKDHPTYVACLQNLGDLYSDMGEHSKAEAYLVEALKIYRSKYGNHHEKTAKCLNNMGSLYRMMGDYAKAESYCLAATQTIKSIFGSKSSEYAVCLQTLGDLYVAMGNYTKAEKHYLDMLAIRKSLVGKYSPLYAGSLATLANVYVNSGNYAQAEEYFLEALSIYKTTVDKYNLDYAVCLNNLAGLYGSMGDYLQAEPYFLQVLEIRSHVLGENHLDCNSPLHNLGSIYHYMHKYSQAEQYYAKALKILESHLGKEHPEYVLTLHNVANLYRDMGKYEQAETYYLYVMRVIKKLVGSEYHPFYATCLNNTAHLYRKIKQYYKSESDYLRALQLRKALLGETHPHYALSLYEIGQLYSDMGNYAKAIEYLTKARKQYKEQYLLSLKFMTEQQRKSYWTTLQEHYDVTYPQFVYQYHTSQPSISTFAYDNELFRKGILLSSSEAIRRSILGSGNSTLIRQWEQLTSIKQNIIYLEENDPNASSLPVFKHRADSLEKIITRSSAAYREDQAMWSINWENVRQHLASNEVAIEFFSVPKGNTIQYCALLLRNNSLYPTLIPLFEEKDIVPLLTNNNDIYNYSVNGKKISQAIWGKVLPKLRAGETIYFSAAGILHQIAIEYLPYDAQRTMSDINTIVRLSSTREIAINKSPKQNTTATIYGGIQYSMYAEDLLLESEPYQRAIAVSRSTNNINRGIVQYLPGTKIEANAINTLMKKNNIITKLYTESKANEESFKALSGKLNNILHIGTHGFMWNDNIHRHTDPLARCGLLFAGSNIALSGRVKELEKGVQDGILTAKEISLLDLRGTDLVVLSACETAKGDITSEGVFGLQRAFKMAGAQTIIMSLWKVDDYATQLLMTEFYTNWISNKYASKHTAFTQAQKTVKTKYPSPECWAGFILLD